MTTTVPSSSHSAHHAGRRAAGPAFPGFSEAAPSESALLSWALTRAGFPAIVRIGREAAPLAEVPPASAPADSPRSPASPSPRFALHLRHFLPVPDLIRALTALRGSSRGAHTAILLTARRSGPAPYREHLQLDGDRFVTSIRRRFVKRFGRDRPTFVGIAWQIPADLSPSGISPTPAAPILSAPRPGPPWHTLRAIYRQAREGSIRRILQLDAALLPAASETCHSRAPYFAGPASRPRPSYELLKRLFDIAFALFAILLTLPICLPIALLIKLYDRGPIFFSHRRETLHGRPFPCLKFRTMVANAETLKQKLREKNQVDGPQFKIASDPRVTPLGHFLRRTNIDELPQFLNVLAGQMSVVGPRPSPFEENQLCPAWREARLSVKPGITGLWQISRSKTRGPTDFQEWIFFDTQYVERRNFLLDIRILLLTVKELLGNGQ